MSVTPTLLLVDDDAVIRPLMAELLTDEGYNVIEAGDGRAAIHVLSEHRPPVEAICLVILNMTLPAASGVEVLRKLAGLGNYTPVVAMSAELHSIDRHACSLLQDWAQI